jgi:hypothetical protein
MPGFSLDKTYINQAVMWVIYGLSVAFCNDGHSEHCNLHDWGTFSFRWKTVSLHAGLATTT